MSFNWLPPEIQQRILLTTLQLEPRAAQQLTNLALSSRDCYATVTRLVWQHIRITRPSTLRLIHAALTFNPTLGELVQSIHIGPEDELDEQGWPLFATHDIEGDLSDWPIPLLATTVKEAELPRWVKPGSSFRLEQPVADCKNHHVTFAIQRAVERLGVQPYRRGYDREGHRIGVRAWAARLWEAQAVLDLYLMEMRRIEEARGYHIVPSRANPASPSVQHLDELCQSGTCGHYPLLEIQRAGGACSSSNRSRLVVTQSQMRSQLARRDGPTNHFEHLILFSRSTRAGLNMSEEAWALLKFDFGGPDDSVFTTADFEYRLKKDKIFALSHGTS